MYVWQRAKASRLGKLWERNTVIGIIGNTQGVSSAAKPEKKEIMTIVHMPICPTGALLVALSVGVATVFVLLVAVAAEIGRAHV